MSSFLFSSSVPHPHSYIQKLVYLHNLCDLFSLQGINIVGPSNAEPTPQPACPAMYQLDIVLKKGNNLAIRDRTGRSANYSSCFLTEVRFM